MNTTKNGQERVIEEHYNKWTVDSAFLLQLILLDGLQPSVNSSSNNYTKFFSKTVVYGSQCVDQQYKRLRIAVVLFLTWPTCRSLGQHVCKSSSFYTFAAIYICLSSIDLCIQLLFFFFKKHKRTPKQKKKDGPYFPSLNFAVQAGRIKNVDRNAELRWSNRYVEKRSLEFW